MRLSILVVLCLVGILLVPCRLRAAEEPTVYVIKKGDTLWGLSAQFLNDPHYWPGLWSKNPQVTNPHLIYPGQTVRFRDGRLEVVSTDAGSQKAAAAPVAAPAAAPEPEPEVAEEKTFTVHGNEGRLMEQTAAPAGRVIAGQHGRLILGSDDTIFTDIGSTHGGNDGAKYSVLRKSKIIRHPVTNNELGYRVQPLGVIQLTQVTALNSRAIISSSYKEIEPGDLLVAYQPIKRHEIAIKMVDRPFKGYIVESATGNNSIAAGDVVYLDLGSVHGVEAGNLLYIIRQVNIEKMLVDRYVGQLPNEVVGALVVVETGNKTSTAIVVKSIDAIFKGNEVVSAPR